MSHIVQAGAVHGLTAALTASTFALEHLGLKGVLEARTSAASVIPLTSSPTRFYVRRDRKDRQKKLKVFNDQGEQVYAFERLSALNPVWSMLTIPQRAEVATINAGFSSRSVDFHTKPGVTHRNISTEIGLNGRFQSFYVADGVKYSWSTGSQSLEKVLNPNGGDEETRERVAKVKLMRQFKFDFEVLVDEAKIDAEVVLATAFVSMLTQWGTGSATDTVGPTYIAPQEVSSSTPQPEAEEQKVVLIIRNEDDADLEIEAMDNH